MMATRFDQVAWDSGGIQWARSVKSGGHLGLVIDDGLEESALSKLADLNFRVAKMEKQGFHSAVLSAMGEGERCVACQGDFKVAESFFAGPGLICLTDAGAAVSGIVLAVSNIFRRAEVARLIEERIVPAYGHPLTATVVGGDMEAWAGFVGYYQYLLHSSFLENRPGVDGVALNMYAANFPGRVRAA